MTLACCESIGLVTSQSLKQRYYLAVRQDNVKQEDITLYPLGTDDRSHRGIAYVRPRISLDPTSWNRKLLCADVKLDIRADYIHLFSLVI